MALCVSSFSNYIELFWTDNEDNLNKEEREFVKENAALFTPEPEDASQDRISKKRKTSDEVNLKINYFSK